MKKVLLHFKKDTIINKKIVVCSIWLFSLVTLFLLFVVSYQELKNTNSIVKVLGGAVVGMLLISGLLLGVRKARWSILLIAYIALLSPFITYFMLLLFAPEFHENFGNSFILPNIIMSVFIITLLSNRISLKLYRLRKNKKARIKEQVYLFSLASILLLLYTYYIYIPFLFRTSGA